MSGLPDHDTTPIPADGGNYHGGGDASRGRQELTAALVLAVHAARSQLAAVGALGSALKLGVNFSQDIASIDQKLASLPLGASAAPG